MKESISSSFIIEFIFLLDSSMIFTHTLFFIQTSLMIITVSIIHFSLIPAEYWKNIRVCLFSLCRAGRGKSGCAKRDKDVLSKV